MRRTLAAAGLLATLSLSTGAQAQSLGDFTEAGASPLHYTLAPERPAATCAALGQMSVGDLTITSTAVVAATADAPEFCRVRGVIAPENQFEVDLPSAWNRRFYMFGNGGYAGESLDAASRQATSARALKAGFATAQTNTGHDAAREPLASFGASLPETIDYAFRAVHRTVQTAKRAAAMYYARPVTFSYWDSCSTGGREGLMEAQRFPADFDGVIAGAPVRNFVDTMVNYVWNAQALDGAGLTLDKVKAVGRALYDKCDAVDGLKDGLIDDPRRCDFKPSRDVQQCAPGSDGTDCLTPAQAGALEKIYAGITLPDGQKYFFGWPLSAEGVGEEFTHSGRQVSGWDGWMINADGSMSRQATYMTTFMKNLAFGRPEPDFDFRKFDFAKDPARMAAIRALLVPDATDLSPFRRRGGKLMMYHGWSDTALNPLMSVDYHERAMAANAPDGRDFFRLFMVPGMAHCGGGVATDRIDAITAMVNWVEAGAAPDSLRASRVQEGRVDRTRPLCPYPQSARYAGSGSVDDAASFSCKDPE